MRFLAIASAYALILTAVVVPCSQAEGKIGERLSLVLNAPTPDAAMGRPVAVWVFFRDKGSHEAMKKSVPTSVISQRSIVRRLNVLPASTVVDYSDLPVEESYVQALAGTGAALRHRSKWFNAASVLATPAQIAAIGQLPFVRALDLVARSGGHRGVETFTPAAPGTVTAPAPPSKVVSLNYGGSFAQLNQINVPVVHAAGNAAQGVIIGVFDNGFRLLSHQAFDSLRTRIIATYDFVEHKVDVKPSNTSTTFGGHGVNTLSTIGGYAPGKLIGPAYGASYILARTENDSSGLSCDFPSEEDNWVAAIEWADSLGVQVTSTSLGYIDFCSPAPSYTWADMNGQTTIVTRAAAMAVRKGIVVLNSAGNEGYNATHNTLMAPADGDSVVAVGAVNSDNTRSSFSSVGPSTSVPPLIKPDVMARGSSVWVASSGDTAGYGLSQGTSFSCPLAAGVAALIIKAHPTATPLQVIEAMKGTASNAAAPNNLLGWGIINALDAINYGGLTDTGSLPPQPAEYALEQNYPNPFNPGTTIRFTIPQPAQVLVRVYDVLGREVARLVDRDLPARVYEERWDGRDASGAPAPSGVYFYRLQAWGASGGSISSVRKMMLLR